MSFAGITYTGWAPAAPTAVLPLQYSMLFAICDLLFFGLPALAISAFSQLQLTPAISFVMFFL
jgi:hypothetical protein